MDDRELMDKIRKSMEDTPVPESLKPENIQKMLEEQSENQQPNEAARTEKDDQPKDTTTHRFWNARTSRYIGAAAAAVVVIAALGILLGCSRRIPRQSQETQHTQQVMILRHWRALKKRHVMVHRLPQRLPMKLHWHRQIFKVPKNPTKLHRKQLNLSKSRRRQIRSRALSIWTAMMTCITCSKNGMKTRLPVTMPV